MKIEQLKKDAKRLRKAAVAGDTVAQQRIREYGFDPEKVIHAQALLVIAREQGYSSWPELVLNEQ